jgi:hypothetical protein
MRRFFTHLHVKTFTTICCIPHLKFINAHILEFKLNMYTLTIYIIDGLFGDIILNLALRLHVGCDYTYTIKIILVVNVNYNYFIVSN